MDPRWIHSRLLFLVTVVAGFAGPLTALRGEQSEVAAPKRPNILFLYLDDLGWKDTGFMGSDFYETPHLDQLARGGTVFTSAYACAANCAPSRAGLLSGQYAPRHRIFNVGTGPRGDARFRRLLHVPGTRTLDSRIVTWAEVLRDQGYATGMFGKWHLGNTPGQQGFETAVNHRKLPGFKGHRGPEGAYLADVLTERTMDFIREHREQPWCAYLAHFAVHTPLQAKRSLLAKYRAKPAGKLHRHVAMATMIQAVDDGVGRIRKLLDELQLAENTLILFTSDNGGFGPATDMDPLWGYKGTYYEGGIRVPFFVHWPGVVPAGKTCDEPIIGVDLYPTLLAVAGASTPDQPLDGRNLLPLWRGEIATLGARPLYWHFPAYLQSYKVIDEQRDALFRTRPCSVVRLGDWKLHQYFEDGGWELYNLRDDVRERHNLVKTHPDQARQLQQLLRDWQRDIGAPLPERPNPKYDAQFEAAALARRAAQQNP